MSILVRGMEMPTGCSAVTLKVWPDDQVEIIDADGEWKTSKAIPVPAHGRLIDADVLTDNWYYASAALRQDDVRKVVCLDDIDSAPTIIEAEE